MRVANGLFILLCFYHCKALSCWLAGDDDDGVNVNDAIAVEHEQQIVD